MSGGSIYSSAIKSTVRDASMRSKAVILVLLLAIACCVPLVCGEDALEWYMKGQNAATAGNYAEAVTYYDNALTQNPDYAAAMSGKAAAFNAIGKHADAADLAEEALAIRSTDTGALNARAYALFRLGRYEEAVSAYDNLFEVQLNNGEAYCNQGYSYFQLGRYEESITAYDRCTSMDPLNYESWNQMGLAYLQLEKYDDSLRIYDRATQVTIKNATIWNNKGVALLELDRSQDALQCFYKALGIDPDYKDAQENRERAMNVPQVFHITGTVTPTATISRIGTLNPTMPVPGQTTGVGGDSQGTSVPATVPVTEKTTYTPLSPLSAVTALVVMAGCVLVVKRRG
jgi:tetratricopeptide (TPR) repeat protein